jgi:hypothetical protein
MSAEQLGYEESARPTMLMEVEKLAKAVKVAFGAIRLPGSERRG